MIAPPDRVEVNILLGLPITKHTQLYAVGAPRAYTALTPDGVGDCFRAAIATILGARTIDDVPHFAYQRNIDEYHAGHQLPGHDIILARRWLRDTHLLDLATAERHTLTDHPTFWIATVHSANHPGGSHAVVGRGDAIIFDPSATDPHHCTYTTADIADDDPTALVLAEPYEPDPDIWSRWWTATLLDDTEGL